MSEKNDSLGLKDYFYRKDEICFFAISFHYSISTTDCTDLRDWLAYARNVSIIYQNLPLNRAPQLKQIKNGLLCRLNGNSISH